MSYPAVFAAHYRLAAAVSSGSAEVLDLATRSERMLLSTYSVNLPSPSECTAHGPVCETAVQILQAFHRSWLCVYTPMRVGADGNCMYRAVSRGIYGHEDAHLMLRLLTTLELLEHRRYYDPESPDHVDLIKDPRIVTAPYTQALADAATPGHYSDMTHIHATSAVLGKALCSYCPPTVNPYAVSGPLTRKVCGRGVSESADPVLTLMWSQASVPRRLTDFHPNHFVPLHRKPAMEEYVDLTATPKPVRHSTPVMRITRTDLAPPSDDFDDSPPLPQVHTTSPPEYTHDSRLTLSLTRPPQSTSPPQDNDRHKHHHTDRMHSQTHSNTRSPSLQTDPHSHMNTTAEARTFLEITEASSLTAPTTETTDNTDKTKQTTQNETHETSLTALGGQMLPCRNGKHMFLHTIDIIREITTRDVPLKSIPTGTKENKIILRFWQHSQLRTPRTGAKKWVHWRLRCLE